MNHLRILVLTAACLVALTLVHYSAAEETTEGIKCYVCVSTEENKDCGKDFKKPEESEGNSTSEEPGEVSIKEDCKFCVTQRVTTKDVAVYSRSCSTTEVANLCVTVGEDSTCTSSCNTDLCNVGDEAPSLRYTLLPIISALLLSLLAKF